MSIYDLKACSRFTCKDQGISVLVTDGLIRRSVGEIVEVERSMEEHTVCAFVDKFDHIKVVYTREWPRKELDFLKVSYASSVMSYNLSLSLCSLESSEE